MHIVGGSKKRQFFIFTSLTRLKAIRVGVGRGWVWAERKKNCGRKESKRRVGPRRARISGAPSEVVHRDPAARSAAVAEIMSKKIELRSIFEVFLGPRGFSHESLLL